MNKTTNFKQNNDSQKIEIALNLLIILIAIHLCAVFLKFYSLNLGLNNPLIPKDLIISIFYPWAQKGLILVIGLVVVLIAKFLKQNSTAIVLSLIVLFVFYITGFRPDFGIA